MPDSHAPASPAITTRALVRSYGQKNALDSLDLVVGRGTVHAVLGPNGAGKTTLIRVLSTLTRPTAGRAHVAGFDVVTEADEVRYRIGLVGQHAALDEQLSGRQNLDLFGRLYHLGRRSAAARADELLHQFGLADTGHAPVHTYSGGMRRRLDLAASLLTAPEVLFLDEPTAGLDPRGRYEIWTALRALTGTGATVLLTTQYLEEADELADRISVVDRGQIIAEGTADELKTSVGADYIDVRVDRPDQLDAVGMLVSDVAGAADAVTIDVDRHVVSARVSHRVEALSQTLRALERAGIIAADVAVRRPTLDDVFLHLTGDQATDRQRADQRAQVST